MSMDLMYFTEKLVSISDFSQGKAEEIFSDIEENNNKYVILNDNQSTAVLLSLKEYREVQEKVVKLEKLLEKVENIRLLKLGKSKTNDTATSF